MSVPSLAALASMIRQGTMSPEVDPGGRDGRLIIDLNFLYRRAAQWPGCGVRNVRLHPGDVGV